MRGRRGRANAWSTIGQGVSSIGQQIMQQAMAREQQAREDERWNKSYGLQERGQEQSERLAEQQIGLSREQMAQSGSQFDRTFAQNREMADREFDFQTGPAFDVAAHGAGLSGTPTAGAPPVPIGDREMYDVGTLNEATKASTQHGYAMDEIRAAQERFLDEIERARAGTAMGQPVFSAMARGEDPAGALSQLEEDYLGKPTPSTYSYDEMGNLAGHQAAGRTAPTREVNSRIWSSPQEMLGTVAQGALGAKTQLAAAGLSAARTRGVELDAGQAEIESHLSRLRAMYGVSSNLPGGEDSWAYQQARTDALRSMAILQSENPGLDDTSAAAEVLNNAAGQVDPDAYEDLKRFLRLPNHSVPVRR